MKVSEFLFKIKNLLEGNLDLRDVWVEGELSQPKFYGTSIYFNLKEETENGVLGCYVSKDYYHKLLNKTEWKDGVKLKILGYISVWNKQGTFKFIVQDLEKDDGLGQKYIELENLKKKLLSEGLFDTKFKKKIPPYPQKVGIVTSLNGAAIHDIFKTMKNNGVFVELTIFPSLVQGDAAPESLINALLEADDWGLDLIILTRGGGSFEDLYCFNDEQLARTIFQLKTPIISAVGHETDVTICDFVADLRVSTPTQSVNLLPNFYQESDKLKEFEDNLIKFLVNKIKTIQSEIQYFNDFFSLKFQNFSSQQLHLLTTLLQQLQNLLKNMILSNQNYLIANSQELENYLQKTLNEQFYLIENQYNNINYLMQNIIQKQIDFLSTSQLDLKPQILFLIQKEKNELRNLELELENNNHARILEKGYSITLKNGEIVKSLSQLQLGDTVQTILKSESFESIVKKL